MKEIVERLHENRQVELAKNILESNGYKVTKKNTTRRLKESSNEKKVSLKSLDPETVESYNEGRSDHSKFNMLILGPASSADTGWVKLSSSDPTVHEYIREINGKAYRIIGELSDYRLEIWDGDTFEYLEPYGEGYYRREYIEVASGKSYRELKLLAEEKYNLPKSKRSSDNYRDSIYDIDYSDCEYYSDVLNRLDTDEIKEFKPDIDALLPNTEFYYMEDPLGTPPEYIVELDKIMKRSKEVKSSGDFSLMVSPAGEKFIAGNTYGLYSRLVPITPVK